MYMHFYYLNTAVGCRYNEAFSAILRHSFVEFTIDSKEEGILLLCDRGDGLVRLSLGTEPR